MKIFKSSETLRSEILDDRANQKTTGFVPTMGALHEGHRRVLGEAREVCDRVVASIFVNPTQFDTDRDAEAYPRQLEDDHRVLDDEGVDYCFEPDHETMYPDGDSTTLEVGLPLTNRYEGEIRPRFFEGVARIVSKFFNIIPSDYAFFGEKDLQQFLMLRRLVRDLHFPQKLRPVPVARDEQGIAYSSRNEGFEPTDWETASDVYDLMNEIREKADALDRDGLKTEYKQKLQATGLELQYLDVVGLPEYVPSDLSESTAVLIVAGYIGEVRLKDNLPLHYNSVHEMTEDNQF